MGYYSKKFSLYNSDLGGSEEDALLRRLQNYNTRLENIGVEPLEAPKKSNLLLTALDILDRPRNAIVSGLAGQGFMKGLTGEVHTNVSDLIGDSIQNKYLRGGLGFVGDVLLDPLTYLTVGTAGAAKGAAQQGARKMLRFAGQDVADVTPITQAIGRRLQKTGIPDMVGPVFSNRHIRRSVTSEDELPDVQKALDLTQDTQRLISGQQQDALDALKGLYAGMSPDAAAQASAIIEAPTLVGRAAPVAKTARPKVTVSRPGTPASLGEILTPLLPPGPKGGIADDALSLPSAGGIGGASPTVRVPGMPAGRRTPFEARPQQVLPETPTGPPAVPGVSTPQVMTEKLIRDARNGVLDRTELNRVAAQLSPEQQEQLFQDIKVAVQSRLPKNVRAELRRAQEPQVSFKGETYTEKDLLANRGIVSKEIADMKKGLAGELRAGAKEAQAQGDIWRQVRERGGIRPHAGGDLAEEYKSIPVALRRKNGLPLDEMASELGMTSNELLGAVDNRKAPAVPTMAEAIKEAEKSLSLDKDYQTSLRAVAKIDELLGELEPGEIPDAIRQLLPKISTPEDVLKPEVMARVKQVSGGAGDVMKLLKNSEKVTLTGTASAAAGRPATVKNLAVPVNKTLQVGFEPKIAVEGPQQVKNLTQSLDEMYSAARRAGIKETPEGRAAAAMAMRVTEETAAKDIAAGVEFTELPNYIRHLYKDPPEKVQQVLAEWMKKRASLPGKKAGFQKERKIPTIAEAKRLGLTPIEDARVLTAVREMEGIKQRGIQNMYKKLEEIGANVVREVKDAPAGWKALPGVPQLKDKAVHPEVARFLERFNATVNSDEGMRTMLSVLNGVQDFWKGFVTAPNPAFHIRNALGNVFNNFLAGVVNPDNYRLAVMVQKGGKETLSLGGKRYTAKQLRTMFREQGLEGFGFFQGESSKSLVREAEETFGQQSMKDKVSLIKGGRKVGDWVETNAKLAHFLDKLNKGDSVAEAASSVRKYLFDYGDLTAAEKKIRAFVPFYTFTRKNLPLQLENLITNPGKMTAMYKLVQNAGSSMGTQEGDMPDWMRSELAVPVGGNKALMLDLPVNQLNMIGGGETLKNALGMLTPLGKVPIELAMGKQVFSGSPIEKYPGAKSMYGNVELPATLTYALSQFGTMPRTAAQIAGSFVDQQPRDSYIPAAPKQAPIAGSFLRKYDPKREALLRALQDEQRLADYVKYLKEVKGIEIPTMDEIKKQRRGLFA